MGVKVQVLRPLDLEQLDRLAVPPIVVGLVGPRARQKHPDANTTVATIGTFQEFGTHQIPARSFLRYTLTRVKRDLQRVAADGADIRKSVARTALSAVGRFLTVEIKKSIRNSKTWARANRPATLRKKQGTIPLIDSGVMLKAITWEER